MRAMVSEQPPTVRRHEDGLVSLDLRGYIDRETVERLDATLGELVEQGVISIVVNCRELDYISSDGMGVFLSHLIRIRKAGGDIKFCALNEEARAVIEVLGLARLLETFDDEAQALAAFRGRGERGSASEDEQARLRVEFEPHGERVGVIRLKGLIDRQTLDVLEAGLDDALARGRACTVIDCSELRYISSSGMGTFIAFRRKAKAAHGDVRFAALRDEVRTVITMLGLQNIFQIFEGKEEAIASYEEQGG